MRRLARAGVVFWLLVCTAILTAAWFGASASGLSGSGSRTLPTCYEPGAALTVAIAVAPDPEVDVSAQVVTDTLPAGWTPGTISNGGTWDPIAQRVTWGPFADSTARLLTYGVTPPAPAGGSGTFAGVVSFDGVEMPVGGQAAIGPCERNPADMNRDWRVAIGEVTGYAAAWKRGLAWDVPPVPIPIGHVTRAGFLWRAGETYRTDAAACPTCWMPSTGQTVGPDGGRLEFPNGVILEVPPGAVNLPTLIEITAISCPEIDAVLTLPRYTTTAERCLGGFNAKPEGFWFNVPVKAIVPVAALLPGEFPTEGDVDLTAQTVRLVPTDIVYRGDPGVVEVFVQHFSPTWFRGRRLPEDPSKCNDDVCREGVRLNNLCSQCSGLTNPECVAYDNLQGPCCLIPPKDRQACGVAGCECCRELEARVVSQEIEFGTRGCQVSAGTFHVSFPQCTDPVHPGVPVWEEETVSEASDCPPNLKYALTIKPNPIEMYECEKAALTATVSAASQDGKTVYRSADAKPFWRSGYPSVADFVNGQDGVLEARPRLSGTDETTTVFAVVSEADPEIKGEAPLTVKAYGPLRIQVADIPGAPPVPLEVPLKQTVQLRASVDGLCGTTAKPDPCAVAWEVSGSSRVTVDGTGRVTGHVLGASEITAKVTHCRTFQTQLPVEVVPVDYEVHAKLGTCDWDAPFCYFSSISAPLPLKVRLTWPDGRPIKGQEVFVSVSAPPTVSPTRGPTNDEGIFEAAITGVPADRPYVIAAATSDVGGLRKNVGVRAITDDFCSGIDWGLGPSFGTGNWSDSDGNVGYSDRPCGEVGTACADVSMSMTDPLDNSESWGQYWQSHYWWDTVVVIPKDLAVLGQSTALLLSFENQGGASAASAWAASAMASVEIHQWGAVGLEADPAYTGCYADEPIPDHSYLGATHNGSLQARACFQSKARLANLSVGVPAKLGASLNSFLNTAGKTSTRDGVIQVASASASAQVSQRTSITEAQWIDNAGAAHPLDAWIFSCSGKFTTPR